MRISIIVCVGSFLALVWILRRAQISLGLPIAYMVNLLILHVPGAIAQLFAHDRTLLTPIAYTRGGIIFTAIGSVAFVVGVFVVHMAGKPVQPRPAARSVYWKFCVLGGGIVTIVGFLINVPSIGAVVSRGGSVWMLGVLLALRSAFMYQDRKKVMRWLGILAVYPVLMLMLGGFMSYGSMAVIIVLSGLFVSTKSPLKVGIVSGTMFLLGMSVFLSYFEHRPEIRAAVWGGGDSDARIDATMAAIKDIKLISASDPAQMFAFDQRLNQNFFVGLAAARIGAGEVDYLYGRSVYEGFQALIPRALWPEKPVVAGSPKIVSEMTGLTLSEGTSFGVGQVMEFQINFGILGVAVGFLILGVGLGALDRRAATADLSGDLGRTFFYFLPAVALIQPNGSIVELMSGTAAALAAAAAWRWGWVRWPKPYVGRPIPMVSSPEPLAS